MPSFLFVAPFSIDSTFITCDLNLDMRFVLILNYKHVRTAGLTVLESHTASYKPTLESKREDIWVLEAHLGVLEVHPEAVNDYSRDVETHTKVLVVYSGDSGFNLERGAYP